MNHHNNDFADAHDRHWKDAERLFVCSAWANADHLYGLSAECGLKGILQFEGQKIAAKYKKHVDQLWPEFVSFAEGRLGVRWLWMVPKDAPFQNWRINQRYAHRCRFNKKSVEPHRNAANDVRRIFQTIQQGGKP